MTEPETETRPGPPMPDETSRWRCTRCGNLTRFDVLRRSRVREFWHVSLGGEPTVEQADVLAAAVEEVRCRWCGASDGIELVPRPERPGQG